MNGTGAIRAALKSTQYLLEMFVSDLSDADLLVRPAPGANHIAWQLGHLIHAERGMLIDQMPGARYPNLPAGFQEQHDKQTAGVEPPAGFSHKGDYIALFKEIRGATLDNLTNLTDADLDRPTSGPMAPYAPTLGDLLQLQANHTLMHAGQFSVVRRKLGKPVLF